MTFIAESGNAPIAKATNGATDWFTIELIV
jgi:hypothetical protein